ncbi:hypothetical protein B0H14DRAFT_2608874 [Mycena olivaceomarginata]|nr:hypothetical protein B0H14DRAFT_2608874 [Mycena olivaceomarginata]
MTILVLSLTSADSVIAPAKPLPAAASRLVTAEPGTASIPRKTMVPGTFVQLILRQAKPLAALLPIQGSLTFASKGKSAERRPPTAPRAERLAVARAREAAPANVPQRPLLDRLAELKKPLLDRLQSDWNNGNRALLDRMKVGLKERVSTVVSTKCRCAHNRPLKRLERMLRMEEEIQLDWEEFRWTDAEINWFINQEEMLLTREDDERMDED